MVTDKNTEILETLLPIIGLPVTNDRNLNTWNLTLHSKCQVAELVPTISYSDLLACAPSPLTKFNGLHKECYFMINFEINMPM